MDDNYTMRDLLKDLPGILVLAWGAVMLVAIIAGVAWALVRVALGHA